MSLDPSVAKEKGLFFIQDTSDCSKCGRRAMFKMHVDLVCAAANPLAIFESGKMSLKSGDKYPWLLEGDCGEQAAWPF